MPAVALAAVFTAMAAGPAKVAMAPVSQVEQCLKALAHYL
jgi:hypothetical protein